jgi:hypothetical protein
MKRLCISALCLVAGANAAMAADNTFTAASGNWNSSGNWSQSSVPDATDRVVIPADKVCTVNVTDAVADTIEIEAGGELIIAAGKILTLDNTDDVSSEIYGTLTLKNSAAQLDIIDNDHVFTGSGTVVGEDDSVLVRIEDTFFLETDVLFQGAMTIQAISGTATFKNYGEVRATGDRIWLKSDLVLVDQNGSMWKVDGDSATIMEFDRAATGLNGNFHVLSCGAFQFDANIYTCGSLKYNGLLDVNSAVFKYAQFDNTSSCGNPKDSGTGGCLSIFTMFTVSSDHDCCP